MVDILVIGESSAQGVPYDKWLSVADIVAWKLGAAIPANGFPGRKPGRSGALAAGDAHQTCRALSGVPSW